MILAIKGYETAFEFAGGYNIIIIGKHLFLIVKNIRLKYCIVFIMI